MWPHTDIQLMLIKFLNELTMESILPVRFLFLNVFDTRAHGAQDSFKLVIVSEALLELLGLLPQLFNFWDCRYGLPYLVRQLILRMGWRICAIICI